MKTSEKSFSPTSPGAASSQGLSEAGSPISPQVAQVNHVAFDALDRAEKYVQALKQSSRYRDRTQPPPAFPRIFRPSEFAQLPFSTRVGLQTIADFHRTLQTFQDLGRTGKKPLEQDSLCSDIRNIEDMYPIFLLEHKIAWAKASLEGTIPPRSWGAFVMHCVSSAQRSLQGGWFSDPQQEMDLEVSEALDDCCRDVARRFHAIENRVSLTD